MGYFRRRVISRKISGFVERRDPHDHQSLRARDLG